MVELVVHVVFDKRKCSNQERSPYRGKIFKVTVSAECFSIIYGKEIPKTRIIFFFLNTINFESGFNYFRNFFSKTASNIYVNRL